MKLVIMSAVFTMSLTVTAVQSADLAACQMPMEVGPCKALLIRYYHNTQTLRCEQFMFGGCYGNDNNFKSMDACQKACTSTTTQMAQLRNDVCSLPKHIGPCDALIKRYYYNTQTGQCETFGWGGCDANANNFETLQECQNVCAN